MSNEQENCTHNCSTCGTNCPSRDKKSLLEPGNKMSNVKKVIAVVSGKGGVGKSMTTALLAINAARAGYKTAIIDADVTGPSIPKIFGQRPGTIEGDENGMFPATTALGIKTISVNLLLEDEKTPVVWRGPVIAGTVKQFWTDVCWGDVDMMFVDCPPGTGDVPLTVFQSLPIDGIVIVTSPQDLVSMIVSKAAKMADMMNIPVLGIVENMSYITCPDCGKKISIFGESHVEEIAAEFGYDVLDKMPIDPNLAALCDRGMLEMYEKDCLTDAFTAVEGKLGMSK